MEIPMTEQNEKSYLTGYSPSGDHPRCTDCKAYWFDCTCESQEIERQLPTPEIHQVSPERY